MYNYDGMKRKRLKNKSEDDNGEFQHQSPQAVSTLKYHHMNGRNYRWIIRLKAIQVEYYYIEN